MASRDRMQLQHLYDSRRWFMVPRDFLTILTPEESIMLGYLINVASISKEKGWFRCSLKKMIINLCMTARTAQRISGSLIKKKIIKRKMMGAPARRHFWIDYERIEIQITSAVDQIEATLSKTDNDENE